MPLPVSVHRAWLTWLIPPLPVDAFRNGRESSVYGIELGLDHLRTRLHSLMSGLETNNQWDYAAFAADALEELHQYELELDALRLAETVRIPYQNFIAASRDVAREFARLGSRPAT